MQVFPPYLFYFSELWSIRVHIPGDEKHRVLETVVLCCICTASILTLQYQPIETI